MCFHNNPNLLKYNVDKAIEDFKDVLRSYPHFDFANYCLGEAYAKKGEKNNAISAYKNTLLDGSCCSIFFTREATQSHIQNLGLRA